MEVQPTRYYVTNCPLYDSVLGEAGGLLCVYTGYVRRHVLKGRDNELLMDGLGKAVMPNGDVYEGDCRLGMFEGLGVMRYANGDLYDGQWENHLRHGYGVLEYADGRSYSGLFREGEKSGTGEEVGSAETYSGSYKEGVASGCGRLVNSQTGDVIDGVFKDGKPHGLCTVAYANGDYFSGTFREGVPHGKGRYVVSTTGDTFFEEFVDGRCVLGVLDDEENSLLINLGAGDTRTAQASHQQDPCLDKNRERQCHIKYNSTGDEYVGGWLRQEIGTGNRRGKPHGHGTLVEKSTGAVYVGTFENGKKEGEGVLTFPLPREGASDVSTSIVSYKGGFHNDLAHGKATVTYSDGLVKEQFFSKGVAHGISHEQRPEQERLFPGEMASVLYTPEEGEGTCIGRPVDYHLRLASGQAD